MYYNNADVDNKSMVFTWITVARVAVKNEVPHKYGIAARVREY